MKTVLYSGGGGGSQIGGHRVVVEINKPLTMKRNTHVNYLVVKQFLKIFMSGFHYLSKKKKKRKDFFRLNFLATGI